jgi:pimeloyl-ACP methyl ester carboxylesterase
MPAHLALLCLHALGSSAREFGAMGARLGDGFEVVDLPGFGETGTDRGPGSSRTSVPPWPTT